MDLAERHRRSQRAFLERFGTYTVEHGSVIAAVTPAAPDRSLPNSIAYADPDDVVPALAELEEVYRSEGIRAWTVWVQPGHDELARALEAAGHSFDGKPAQMAAEIDALELSPADDVTVVPVDDWRVVGEINDAAYGISGLTETFGAYRGDDLTRGWLALRSGQPLATASVLEWEGDAFVVFVATMPSARGRGLCRGLLSHGLRVARENGCTTTTLEGSPMGEPLYERMGYRTLGRLQLWERRISNDSA